MALAIELCRTCGFDIPVDSGDCPGCAGTAPGAPPLAARQAAGLALPTRSVHPLPTIPPRKDVTRQLRQAHAARTVLSFTSSLALFTLVAATATWLSAQPRLVLLVPAGTSDLFGRVTSISAAATVVALGLGFVAVLEWCARAALLKLAARRQRS